MQRFLFLKKCKKFLTIGYQWCILYIDEGGMELEVEGIYINNPLQRRKKNDKDD